MVADATREALRKALGREAVAEHEPIEIDGARAAVTLRPADAEELAAAVRVLAGGGAAAVVRGGGSRLRVGNVPRRADVVLATDGLAGIAELDAEEGVVRAGAGTPLADVCAAADAAGWTVPLDPPGARPSLGGTLASGAVGPRHLGFGRPRDAVLGLEVVLGDGLRARCGGRVVKNVTGYDLMRLHVGAFGTLGVIESAWLRLRPAPERQVTVSAAVGSLSDALPEGLSAARLASARAAVLLDPTFAGAVDPAAVPGATCLLVVELAGDEPVVERDRQDLAERLGAVEGDPGTLDRVRGLEGDALESSGLQFRIAARPSRLGEALVPLARAGAALAIHPGSGLFVARFPLGADADERAVDAAWRAAQTGAEAGAGSFVLEAAPTWVKEGRDVFGAPPESLPVLRALKQRFDPAGILNPGRFVGCL